MFIEERILSLFIFLSVLIFVCVLLVRAKTNIQLKKILNIYLLMLLIMSFCFIPSNDFDIYRLENYMRNMFSEMSLSEFIEKLPTYKDFSTTILFFVLSKTDIRGFLSCISSLIVYGIIFYTLYDYAYRYKVDGKDVAKTLFTFMILGQFMEVISGIKTLISFSIIYLCFYREFIQQKSIFKNLLLYVLAIGFHFAVVPIIIIRVLYILLKKENNINRRMINVLIFFVVVFLGILFGQKILMSTYNYGINYINNKIYFYSWEYIIACFVWIVCLLFNIFGFEIYSKNTDKLGNDLKDYSKLIFLVLIFCVLFFNEYTFFHRYTILASILMLPVILNYYSTKAVSNFRQVNGYGLYVKKNTVLLIILLTIIFSIVFTRGNLCGLKFWVFK